METGSIEAKQTWICENLGILKFNLEDKTDEPLSGIWFDGKYYGFVGYENKARVQGDLSHSDFKLSDRSASTIDSKYRDSNAPFAQVEREMDRWIYGLNQMANSVTNLESQSVIKEQDVNLSLRIMQLVYSNAKALAHEKIGGYICCPAEEAFVDWCDANRNWVSRLESII